MLARDMLAPFARFREVSILCYHSAGGGAHFTSVSAAELESHLQFLQSHGYIFVSLGDIVGWMDGQRSLPQRAVALTFDDGYADFETLVVPLLKKYKAPAALFVIGSPQSTGWQLDEEPPFLSAEALGRLGHEPLVEVGYHSRSHPDLEKIADEDLAREVAAPFPAKYFAYPGGHYSSRAVEAVRAAGYSAAFSIKPTLIGPHTDRYLMPRSVIVGGARPWQLRFATTKAAEWYRTLWRLFI